MDKILVVDDEKGVCHSFKKILGRHGYDVITANNGIEAVEKTGKSSHRKTSQGATSSGCPDPRPKCDA